jgi:hypothetical protein
MIFMVSRPIMAAIVPCSSPAFCISSPRLNQFQTIFKAQGTCLYQRRKLSQRVTCCIIGFFVLNKPAWQPNEAQLQAEL